MNRLGPVHQIALGQIPLACAPIPNRIYQCQQLVEGGIAQRCMRDVFVERLEPHAPGYRRDAKAKLAGGRWRQQSRFLATRLHAK
jgi:hypothetical protein